MRRITFWLALPLIGLAGFALSFYSPAPAHAHPAAPLAAQRSRVQAPAPAPQSPARRLSQSH